ncbi:hypothetical protein C4544_07235 [candidate division WS5 bacterium]|uniref:Uncharacterized protein n=1 Tax=candidate division WS5 bacterium TaxID=2093353 RepID=A0A419DAG4_9BACT|nr:MAG: hypothetical protein C4544_07235 [candidate division WS5 bacterium]
MKQIEGDELNELRESLLKDREFNQTTLNEMRRERVNLTLSAAEKYNRFITRIGELSFAVSVAITPVLLITENQNRVDHIEYIFAGLITFLLVGLGSVFKTKTNIESEATSYPSMGLELEGRVQQMNNAINKMLWDPNIQESREEFIKTRSEFVKNSGKQKENKERIYYFLDGITGGFLLGTFLIMRSIWPYSQALYIKSGLLLVVFFLIMFLISLRKTKKMMDNKRGLNDKIKKTNKDYLDWQDKEIFKNEK